MNDGSREFALVGCNKSKDLTSALKDERIKSKLFENNVIELAKAKRRADDLMYRMVPKSVASSIKNGADVSNLCEVNRIF